MAYFASASGQLKSEQGKGGGNRGGEAVDWATYIPCTKPTMYKGATVIHLETCKLQQGQAYKNEITRSRAGKHKRTETKSVFLLELYLISHAQQIPSREEAHISYHLLSLNPALQIIATLTSNS